MSDFQLMGSSLTDLRPVKWIALARELMKGLGSLGKVKDEPPAVQRQTQKSPNLLNGLGRRVLSHCTNQLGIRPESIWCDDMAQELHFFPCKLALGCLQL